MEKNQELIKWAKAYRNEIEIREKLKTVLPSHLIELLVRDWGECPTKKKEVRELGGVLISRYLFKSGYEFRKYIYCEDDTMIITYIKNDNRIESEDEILFVKLMLASQPV